MSDVRERVRLPPAELITLTPDVFTEPFWRAAAEHRLVVPRCTSCGTFRLPPSAFCWTCRAQEVDWVEQPGRGTIYSFTVVRHPLMPDLADTVPHVPAVVELPDTNGCRLIGPMVDCAVADVRIGLDVELAWRDVDDGVSVPTWRPSPLVDAASGASSGVDRRGRSTPAPLVDAASGASSGVDRRGRSTPAP